MIFAAEMSHVVAQAPGDERVYLPMVRRLPLPGLIVFASNRDGNQEIYTMNADGSGATRLTGNPASDVGADWGMAAP